MTAPRSLLRTAILVTRAARAPTAARAPAAFLRPTSLRAALPAAHAPWTASVRALSVSAARADRYNPVAGDKRWENGDKVTYDELKPITQSPSDKVLLIDVREPAEVALGSIPSSVNLPLSSFEKSLAMDEEDTPLTPLSPTAGDFTRVNGFHKPTKKQPMIFYCKAGVRAQTAVDLARSQGYKLARNYEGSYNDWVAKEGANQDD
ncbi:hypothetical protein JCM10449v2_006390 [Rhodotorula kratochvilovae]